jgi:hypothetical protein
MGFGGWGGFSLFWGLMVEKRRRERAGATRTRRMDMVDNFPF